MQDFTDADLAQNKDINEVKEDELTLKDRVESLEQALLNLDKRFTEGGPIGEIVRGLVEGHGALKVRIAKLEVLSPLFDLVDDIKNVVRRWK